MHCQRSSPQARTSVSEATNSPERARRGVVAVEAAVVLPLVVLLMLHVFTNAASAGAAYAARHTSSLATRLLTTITPP
jgi:hypothetical protein